MEGTTLEWFGCTTFRLQSHGIIIFLDTWLERPSILPHYLSIDEVNAADYIVISHAHFDHLSGADRLARKTGAIIIANGEAINVMRQAGIPEKQLILAAGGERIPLFTKAQREQAASKHSYVGPAKLNSAISPVEVHIWPALHCLMPEGEPREVFDTAEVFEGSARLACTLDITQMMSHLIHDVASIPVEALSESSEGLNSLAAFMRDKERNRFACYDGGQLMYNFLLGDKVLLFSAHLGGYKGILCDLQPRPDIAILAIAGRANLNGRPFDGSSAQFVRDKIKWIGEPKKVIWCLHDDFPVNPKRIDTRGATELVERETKSKIWNLEHVTQYRIS